MSRRHPFLTYLELGWSVLPLGRRSKQPDPLRLPWALDPVTGTWGATWQPLQACCAPARLARHWYEQDKRGNVGIVTGAVSGLVVLDLDGPAALAHAEREGLPPTPVAATAQGRHHYFLHPGGTVPNRVALAGIGGLDLRGDGGYVVAPPSRHPSGTVYRWLVAPWEAALAPCPAWLLAALGGEAEANEAQVARATPLADEVAGQGGADPAGRAPLASGEGEPPACLVASDERTAKRLTAWAQAALAREADGVAATAPGGRNHALNQAAFRLGQLVGAGLLVRGEVEGALLDAALVAGLGEREARRTIGSGLGAGKAEPRPLPAWAEGVEA